MSDVNTENFIIAQTNERFVPEFHGKLFTLADAKREAQAYANRTGEFVFIWDLEFSFQPKCKPILTVKPYRPGMSVKVDANRGIRDGLILAIIDDVCLIEYYMPGGTTALRFGGAHNCDVYAFGGSISYNRVPKRWRAEVEKNGYDLDCGNPQKRRN